MIEEFINLCSWILILSGIILFIVAHCKAKKNKNFPTPKNSLHRYAILIPARYESLVIENLLLSIKNQTMKINMEDVYVIVESETDETVNISKKYNASVFIRKEIENRRTKGYALDETIKYILSKNLKYDAYFIFDADNILKDTYMEEITKTFDEGYDIGLGYRNLKNKDPNVISICSYLTFSMLNNISNDFKKKYSDTMILSGTGFYIKGDIIENLKGYPFNTLTEDYELTLYANLNDFTSYYNVNAEFFDEQPTVFKETIKQRIRWIRGYFDCRKKYIHDIKEKAKLKDNNYGAHVIELIGVKPYILSIIGVLTYVLNQVIFMFINTGEINILFNNIFEIMFYVYLFLFAFTFFMLATEYDKIKISVNLAIRTLLFNPFYLLSYIYCAIIALIKKDIKWDRIEHKLN